MDRRLFFTKTRSRKTGPQQQDTGFGVRTVTTGLAPYNGPWTRKETAHLLKRTMFGAKGADITYFSSMSVGAAVDELLTYQAVPPPLRDYGLIDIEGVLYDDLGVPQGQTWVNDPNMASDPAAQGSIDSLRVSSLLKWWAGLMIHQTRSITEKMVLFWHHHFSVQKENVGSHRLLYKHHNLLRTNALGNVKQLVKDVTVDPAMLLHLNGVFNSKRAPDENYARELQELFTIGKGNGSGYTENDVIEAARVLTGWRINVTPAAVTGYLETSEHDMGGKTFSAFYSNTSIAGNATGTAEVDALVDMIFNTAEAARFICRKLYKWFVYYDIDATVETNVIEPLGDILRNNNFNVTPVLAALLKSEHFFDPLNQACYIKSPLDFIVGGLREMNVTLPPITDYINGYPLFNGIYSNAARMQQRLFEPPDVSGWPSYYQDPMFYELWVHSNSLPKRANYTDGLIQDGVIDVRFIVNSFSNPADPDVLVDDTIQFLLAYPLSAASKTWTKNRFLTSGGPNSNWTAIWNGGNNATINNALKELFRFVMNLPEYHLC